MNINSDFNNNIILTHNDAGVDIPMYTLLRHILTDTTSSLSSSGSAFPTKTTITTTTTVAIHETNNNKSSGPYSTNSSNKVITTKGNYYNRLSLWSLCQHRFIVAGGKKPLT